MISPAANDKNQLAFFLTITTKITQKKRRPVATDLLYVYLCFDRY